MQKRILFVEPFYGGSHKQLIDTITQALLEDYDLITLPPKKWHWRARCSALIISQLIPKDHKYKILFCSSVLSLAELLGLRPDLQNLKKIVYFHENQLIYPKQEIKQRDFQYGYNQITTCLAADLILFNSSYNMKTFLQNIKTFLKIMPDNRPKNLQIEQKCKVYYFPINIISPSPQIPKDYNKILHIIWPHRWEFDKGPDDLFKILYKLKELNVLFKISVLGETFTDVPDQFNQAKELLKDHILNWGYLEKKEDYYKVLHDGHVVLSTAKHEFFGVAVLEAVYYGCYPLVPNFLVYPEIYDKQCLYNNITDVVNILKDFSENVPKIESLRNQLNIDFKKYLSEFIINQYLDLFISK